LRDTTDGHSDRQEGIAITSNDSVPIARCIVTPQRYHINAPSAAVTTRRSLRVHSAALLFATFLALQAAAEPTGAFQEDALRSVGRLLVPAIRFRNGYAQHFDEQCSGTLVQPSAGAALSDLVLSAWHCLEHYRDTSRPLLFVSAAGQQRHARMLTSGGSMFSDWVLLRLESALPHPVAISLDGNTAQQRLVMAGYPRVEQGEKRPLQRAVDCRITGRDHNDQRSDCVLNKGASGGAVFSASDLSLLGVISRGDGVSQSIFVPVSRFQSRIRAYLAFPDPGLEAQ